MDNTSKQRLEKVHPELAKRITDLIATLAAEGQDIRVVQGLRTYAEQDALYAQGRTKPGSRVTNARGGYSNHNFGLAVDLCPFKGGQPDWNDIATFNRIGAEGKKRGLTWGGDWKTIVDRPHLELKGLTVAQCRNLFAKGGLQAVWAESSRKNGLAADATETSIPQPLLKRGSRGDSVVFVQKRVGVAPDGIFGNDTEKAVISFQKMKGLKADGVVGQNTWRELLK